MPSTPPSFAPLPESGRLAFLDSLRGFALFGILLVNMLGFKFSLIAAHPVDPYHPGLANLLALEAIDLFAAGKFVAIFSFLFGLGLVIQRERCVSAGRAFTPFLLRRMTFMLLLGSTHGILLWAGDVLADYAVFGFLAVFLIRLSARTLFILAVISLGFVNLCYLPSLWFEGSPEIHMDDEWRETVEAWVECYQTGTLDWIISSRFSEWTHMWKSGLFHNIPYAFAFFLLGMSCGKAGILGNAETLRPFVRKWALPALAGGLLLSAIYPAIHFGLLPYSGVTWYLAVTGHLFGSVILALTYLASVCYFLRTGRFPRIAEHLSAVGRLSLSNYLLQSVIANFIFMSWGLALYGKVTAPVGILLSVLIFIFQVLLSRLWLRRFRIGPLEWLWRRFSYPAPHVSPSTA